MEYLHQSHNSQISGGNGYEEQTSYDKMKKFELGRVTAALGDLVVSYGDRNQYGVGEDYGSTWTSSANGAQDLRRLRLLHL